MSLPKILVVIPCFQAVYPRALENFLAMYGRACGAEKGRYELYVTVPERQILHDAMNRVAASVVKDNFDAVIVGDDDCFPPITAISQLLRHFEEGKLFVAGLGFMRNYPYTTTIGRYFPEGVSICRTPDGETKLAGFEWVDDVTEEPDMIPADFCGFPIALFTRACFERIEGQPFGTMLDGGSCTHDVHFGTKATRAGIQLFVDKRISCGHMAPAPIVTGESRQFMRDLAKAFITHQAQSATVKP